MGDLSWRFGNSERKYIEEVLSSGFASSSSGGMNSRLEKAFAERWGRQYAVTLNSGTTTLHASLEAAGVGYGDEVIVTPLTVISCMNAIIYCNAIPVFVDVDPDSFLMCPKDLEKRITSKTKAIMAVHLYGQVCDMDPIMQIARKHKLFVLEDCAQCYLGTYKGKLGGSIGDVASWSFENSKHLTCGDGGIIATDNEEFATKIRSLSSQGFKNISATDGKIRARKDMFQDPEFKRHDKFGFMYRLPEVAAAMALGQLEKVDLFVEKRVKMANMLKEVMYTCDWLVPQKTPEGDINSHFCLAAKFLRNDISWYDFRNKYMECGGDGIYAAWTLLYQEDSIGSIRERLKPLGLNEQLVTDNGICPQAEILQKQIMQFTTNQHNEEEMKKQVEALNDTIHYFDSV